MRLVVPIIVLIWTAGSAWCDTSTLPTVLGPAVKGVKLGPGADFSGKYLRGTQVVGVDLSNANFDNADLSGALFLDCNLTGASFRDASLSGAHISDCNFADVDFSGASITGILPAGGRSYANIYLSPEDLVRTDSFQNKTLQGYAFPRATLGKLTDLRGFDLRGARLLSGDFRDVQLDDARITGASFMGVVDFEQLRATKELAEGYFPASFYAHSDCNLAGLDLRGSYFHFSKDIDVDLKNANIEDCRLWFGGSKVTETLASTKSFQGRVFRGTRVVDADLTGFRFDHMILDQVDLSQCDLTGTTFHGTVFSRAELSPRAKTLTAAQLKESWNFQQGLMHELRIPQWLEANMKKPGQ
jgi:uncharacterized protein YjbI with pentapeptide repeats